MTKKFQQIDFSSVLFDTLFGLILFFAFDSFLKINLPAHFLFYLWTMIITIHWWLMFKSADDAFNTEVTDSAVDLVVGIIEVVLIEYIILSAATFNLTAAIGFTVALFVVDLLWALAWRYAGKWETADQDRIYTMEKELQSTMLVDGLGVVGFAVLWSIMPLLMVSWFVGLFIAFYAVLIVMSFRRRIIDLHIF